VLRIFSRLKLALIQVSGDVNRRCKTEFNEQFDFGRREVDEVSRSRKCIRQILKLLKKQRA